MLLLLLFWKHPLGTRLQKLEVKSPAGQPASKVAPLDPTSPPLGIPALCGPLTGSG